MSIVSCDSDRSAALIDKEDREVVDGFLRYIAISEQGAYTILGSKPVTEFRIPSIRSSSELNEDYNAMPAGFRKKVSFKKFDTTEQIVEFRELCRKWKQVQHKYMSEHFAIHFEEDGCEGFVVNIPLVTYVLRRYYQEFVDALGMEFDPSVAAKDIGIASSDFWKVFVKKGNAFLWGLLFGYGEKNSRLFQWEREGSISFPFRSVSTSIACRVSHPIRERRLGENLKNLGIPRFIVYQPLDETVERYVSERERILRLYEGRDFAEATILFLRGEAGNQLRPSR